MRTASSGSILRRRKRSQAQERRTLAGGINYTTSSSFLVLGGLNGCVGRTDVKQRVIVMPQFFCQISGSDEISKKRIHGKGRRPRGGEAIGMCEAVRLNIPRSTGNKACHETSWANGPHRILHFLFNSQEACQCPEPCLKPRMIPSTDCSCP